MCVDGILVLGLCDVVVLFDAILPTVECGVDDILVHELCNVVVVFDAIFSTAACGVCRAQQIVSGVYGILGLEHSDERCC